MDFIKNAASKVGGGNKDASKDSKSSGGDDYVDKAFAAGSKQAGLNISKDNQEKITDGARDAYEKYSGKNVPDKVSN